MLPGMKAKVVRLEGGRVFQMRLRTRGIREGSEIELLTIQPRGPLVLIVGSTQVAMGRGMASKVIVEV